MGIRGVQKVGVSFLTFDFSNCKAKSALTLNDLRQKLAFLSFSAEVDDWWKSNCISTPQCPNYSQVAAPSDLINANEVMKGIPLFWLNTAWELNVSYVRCYCCWIDSDCGVATKGVFQ